MPSQQQNEYGSPVWYADDGSGPYNSYEDAAAAGAGSPSPTTQTPLAPGTTGDVNNSPGWNGQTPPPGWEDANRPPGGYHWDATTGSWAKDAATGSSTTTPTTPGATGPGWHPPDGAPQYTGPASPDMSWWQDAPQFSWQYDGGPFKAPTMAEAAAAPGYEFARGEGLRALTQSKAGQGIQRTGGSLKDLIGYGNTFATQNYKGVFDQNASVYDRNYNNSFNLAKQAYEPQLASWQDKMTANGHASDETFNRAFDAYKSSADSYYKYWHDTVTNPNA